MPDERVGKPTSGKPPWGAVSYFCLGLVLALVGAGLSTSFGALLPGIVLTLGSAPFLLRHAFAPRRIEEEHVQAPATVNAEAPTGSFVGMLIQPMKQGFVATSFLIVAPHAEAQELASCLRSDSEEMRSKVRALMGAATEAEWLGHRLVCVDTEAAAMERQRAWVAELEDVRQQSESSYRGEVLGASAERWLVTWLLALHVTGSIPTRTGLGELRMQWWLDELLATEVTEVLDATVILTRHLHGDVERLGGAVLSLHR